MNRYSRSSKKKNADTPDENPNPDQFEQPAPPPGIAEHHLRSLVPLGRPPRNDEEKQEVFTQLIRLKENRKTNKECADLLRISERTIVNYMADPYYAELVQVLQQDAKQRGHLLISETIDDAVGKLFTLMHTANSEFVQYKSAEYLLKIAGFEIPQESRERDNQADVIAFLSKLDTNAKKPHVQVNVQINHTDAPTIAQKGAESMLGPSVVESSLDDTRLIMQQQSVAPNDELARYLRPMLPGGKIPQDDDE